MLLPKPVRPVDSEKKGKDNWLKFIINKFLIVDYLSFNHKNIDNIRYLYSFLLPTNLLNNI